MTIKVKNAFSLIELSIVILIIGILIAGIVKGQQLYQKTILATVQKVTEESPVNVIPGLDAWYETTKEASFATTLQDDDPVDSWLDTKPKIFGENHVSSKVSGLDTRRPKYVKGAFVNNIPALEFTNTGVSTSSSNSCLLDEQLTSSSEKTIFIVMKRKSYVTQQHSLALSSATGASTEIALVFWEGISAQDRLILWKSGGVSVINASHPGKNVGFMASATFRANDTAALHINGQTNNANAAFLTDNMSTASRLTIGCRATSDTTFTQGFDGYIAEIIVYNRALKSSERKQIENYLSNKFAIKI